jgi:hypothetical protein
VIFALGAREHFFDVVETADTARTEVETARSEVVALAGRDIERVESCAQNLIHERFEPDATLPLFALQPRTHVIIERQRGSHIMMLDY